MNFQDIKNRIKPPCPKCPYRLGLIEALKNPCPQCKDSGYKTYEQFKKNCIQKGCGQSYGL